MTAELVRQATHTVTIDGTARDADSISIEREIATSMPAQVAGGGGVVKASGTIALGEPGALVTTERASPWSRRDGWPPPRNAPVTIDTAINDTTATRRFTGRVAASQSSTREHVALDIEDYTDRLKVPISQPALARAMPPPGDLTGSRLYVSLRADWFANVIFRKAGFYTTPRVMGVGALSVPAQGSMWPETGACRSCANSSGSGLPGWNPAEWGWAVADVTATYGPPDFGNQTLRGRSIALGMMVGAEHTTQSRMDVILGTSTLTMRVLTSRQIELRRDGNVLGTYTPAGAWTRIESVWSASGTITLRSDTAWSRQATWAPNAAVLDGAYARTDLTVGTGGRAAGFMVQFVPNSYSGGYATTPAGATIVPGSVVSPMRALPSITSRDGLDLLSEISKATVTSMWIDRDGHLWWVHPDRLRNQTPALELTSTADLLDLAWEDTSDSARRSVTVTYDDPTIRLNSQYKLTAWEGSGDTLDQGETVEEIITPPSGTDWIDVSNFGQAIYATPAPSNPAAIPGFNRGIGSWVGGSHLNSDGDTPASKMEDGGSSGWVDDHDYPNLQRSLERIGPAAWKLTIGVQDISDNYWVSIQQALDLSPSLNSRINGSWQGQKMPILRCKGITDWEAQEYTSLITGPAQYDDLTHDIGPWASGYAALGDWIARQVTAPAPILRDLPIVYRPDIQVGQVITVTEDIVYGVQLRCLVIGIREDHTRGSTTMRLTCRVISVQRLWWTYDEMTRYWDIKGGDYDTQTATGQTYNQVAPPPADLADVLNTPLIAPLPAPLPHWRPDHDDDQEEGS